MWTGAGQLVRTRGGHPATGKSRPAVAPASARPDATLQPTGLGRSRHRRQREVAGRRTKTRPERPRSSARRHLPAPLLPAQPPLGRCPAAPVPAAPVPAARVRVGRVPATPLALRARLAPRPRGLARWSRSGRGAGERNSRRVLPGHRRRCRHRMSGSKPRCRRQPVVAPRPQRHRLCLMSLPPASRASRTARMPSRATSAHLMMLLLAARRRPPATARPRQALRPLPAELRPLPAEMHRPPLVRRHRPLQAANLLTRTRGLRIALRRRPRPLRALGAASRLGAHGAVALLAARRMAVTRRALARLPAAPAHRSLHECR